MLRFPAMLMLLMCLFCLVFFRKRKDLDASKCEQHEKSVKNVTSTIGSMTNPFDGDQV